MTDARARKGLRDPTPNALLEVPRIVGAYAALGDTATAPGTANGLRALAARLRVGFEIPLYSDFPRWSDADFILAFSPHGNVITLIPALFAIARRGAGLAADADPQRSLAISLVRRAQAFADELNARSPGAIIAIVVTSAPSRAGFAASPGALEESLRDLSDGTDVPITLEHCDAYRDGEPFEKGYLPIEDEIAACQGAGTRLTLNWGRSAIDVRSTAAPAAHLELAAAAGVLGGVMISGATNRPSALGDAWTDTHAPLSETAGLGQRWEYASNSLLGAADASAWLTAARWNETLLYDGAKIGVLPEFSLTERLSTLERTLELLGDADEGQLAAQDFGRVTARP